MTDSTAHHDAQGIARGKSLRTSPETLSGPGESGAGHPAPSRGVTTPRRLWFGLLGAPIAWSAQLLGMYALTGHTCYPNLRPLAAPTIGYAALWAGLWTIAGVTLAIGVVAGIVAIQDWLRTRHEARGERHWVLDTGAGRTRFMAASAIITSVIFVIAMLAHIESLLAITPC